MSAMPNRINQSALRPLQLCVSAVLRQAGCQDQAGQGESISHAAGNSAVQGQSVPRVHSWFAERIFLGTPLSLSELQHGVNAGIISSTLLR